MNGRVYDPVIGRFVSPDPWIQDPENSQSFNRYSYVWNNPLRYTDPTGELTERERSCGRCSIIEFGGTTTIGAGKDGSALFSSEYTVDKDGNVDQVYITSKVPGIKPKRVKIISKGEKTLRIQISYHTDQLVNTASLEETSKNFGAKAQAVNTEHHEDHGDIPAFHKNEDLADNILIDPETGNVEINLSVSAEKGQEKARNLFVKRARGSKTVKGGCNFIGRKCATKYTVTFNITALNGGRKGDIHIVSRAGLAAVRPLYNYFLSIPSNCTDACATPGDNYMHINRMNLSGNKLRHELFHNIGFRHGNRPEGDFMHTNSGEMKPSHVEELHYHFGR